MPDWSGRRWRPLGRIGFIVLLQSAPTRASGQAIPKPDYVTYLPRDVALPVQATSGTRLFHLFGDSTAPGYRDAAPDGRLRGPVPRSGPVRPPAADPPRPDLDIRYVMYFDFPGQDPASWNREFEGSVHGAIARKYLGYAKAFVHPFISDVRGPGFEPPRYELVLQYWFFYPYNDAGNVHEGDWEHINVVVTPQRQGTQPLAAAAMW